MLLNIDTMRANRTLVCTNLRDRTNKQVRISVPCTDYDTAWWSHWFQAHVQAYD